MKRSLAVLGVTGLALLGATAPAQAGDDSDNDHKITICHATGSESNPYVSITVDVHAAEAHYGHQNGGDIIPGYGKWHGQNWGDDGQATYNNGCVPCPPVDTPEEPPVVTPEEPVVTPEEPPVVVTPEEPVVTPEAPPVAAPVVPIGAVVAPPAAPARVVINPGYNVQTAVAGSDAPFAPWAASLIVMMLAAAGVAARRILPAGSAFRNR
ncbi:MAG: hypothetical protein JWQ56_1555 [Pseudarthrobacter sp.]|nr:hypothetical protein [Pseudarthrobacter sp.]